VTGYGSGQCLPGWTRIEWSARSTFCSPRYVRIVRPLNLIAPS
jgi:hypothetical protein